MRWPSSFGIHFCRHLYRQLVHPFALLWTRKTGGYLRQIRRKTYSTLAAKMRSIRALFIDFRLLCMVLGVIR